MNNEFPKEFHSTAFAPVVLRDTDGTHTFSPIQELRDGNVPFSLADDDAERKALLKKLADGENVELTIEFRAFQQVDGESNANHLRFKKGILRGLARSFVGAPLIRDHDQGDLMARAGTVTQSSAVKIDGGIAFDMTAVLTAPWAVEALLRGNLDRFSIGWRHGGEDTIMCSVCKAPALAECFHMPGDKVSVEDGGDAQLVEFVFTEATGVEVSGVSVPAVDGTGISEVRAALSNAVKKAAKRKDRPMKDIAKALGLSDDASGETILAAIDARKQVAEAAEAKARELEERNSALAATNEELSASVRARAIDSVFADHADRFPIERDENGDRVVSKLETSLRALAANDLDNATQILSTLPKATPVGETHTKPELRAPAPTASPDGWNELVAKQFSQLGMSKEDFLKYGPQAEQPSLMEQGLDWVEFATAKVF